MMSALLWNCLKGQVSYVHREAASENEERDMYALH